MFIGVLNDFKVKKNVQKRFESEAISPETSENVTRI